MLCSSVSSTGSPPPSSGPRITFDGVQSGHFTRLYCRNIEFSDKTAPEITKDVNFYWKRTMKMFQILLSKMEVRQASYLEKHCPREHFFINCTWGDLLNLSCSLLTKPKLFACLIILCVLFRKQVCCLPDVTRLGRPDRQVQKVEEENRLRSTNFSILACIFFIWMSLLASVW